MMRKAALLASLLILAPLVGAIELSLEENKADRGNIGYIDMQRLFKTFPDTIRAKENFEELVRQAEEQLNLRKAEILRARNDLSQMRIEREFLAKTPIEIPKPPKTEAPKQKAAEKPVEAPKPTPAPVIEVPKPAASVPTPPPIPPPPRPRPRRRRTRLMRSSTASSSKPSRPPRRPKAGAVRSPRPI